MTELSIFADGTTYPDDQPTRGTSISLTADALTSDKDVRTTEVLSAIIGPTSTPEHTTDFDTEGSTLAASGADVDRSPSLSSTLAYLTMFGAITRETAKGQETTTGSSNSMSPANPDHVTTVWAGTTSRTTLVVGRLFRSSSLPDLTTPKMVTEEVATHNYEASTLSQSPYLPNEGTSAGSSASVQTHQPAGSQTSEISAMSVSSTSVLSSTKSNDDSDSLSRFHTVMEPTRSAEATTQYPDQPITTTGLDASTAEPGSPAIPTLARDTIRSQDISTTINPLTELLSSEHPDYTSTFHPTRHYTDLPLTSPYVMKEDFNISESKPSLAPDQFPGSTSSHSSISTQKTEPRSLETSVFTSEDIRTSIHPNSENISSEGKSSQLPTDIKFSSTGAPAKSPSHSIWAGLQIDASDKSEMISEVTEAAGAPFIGSTFIIFVVIEGVLFFLMDLGNYRRDIRLGINNVRSFTAYCRN